MDFKTELTKAAAIAENLILTDDFPVAIEPDFLREAVLDYPSRGGKRLRPALLLWSCGAVGGDVTRASAASAAVEIFHNWTLVHDDIIDEDRFRRGQPTSHAALEKLAGQKYALTGEPAAKFGRDFALLTGDLQQAWANHMLLRSTEFGVAPELVLALARRMQDFVNRELISGEALDVEFPLIGPEGLDRSAVDRMLYLKTGVLLRFCAETGAMIGTGSADIHLPSVQALGEFAAAAGVAFQYRDDYLGIFGDEAKFGKPVGSDLAEAKPTVLLISALQRLDDGGKKELLSCLRRPAYPSEVLETARRLIRDSGAEAFVLAESERLAGEAAGNLAKLPSSPYRTLLETFLRFLIDRTC